MRSSLIQASCPFGRSGVGTPNQAPLTRSIQKTRMEPNSVLSPTRCSTLPPGEARRAILWPVLTVASAKLRPFCADGGGFMCTSGTGTLARSASTAAFPVGAGAGAVIVGTVAPAVPPAEAEGCSLSLPLSMIRNASSATTTAPAAIQPRYFMSGEGGIRTLEGAISPLLA